MKERLFAAGMLQHSGLGIVDEHLKWNTAKELECVLMSAQEVFGRLAEAKLEVTQAAVAKHHDKKDSRLLVEPTAIEPAQPQSTCAHSPGANARVRNAGARTRRTVRT